MPITTRSRESQSWTKNAHVSITGFPTLHSYTLDDRCICYLWEFLCSNVLSSTAKNSEFCLAESLDITESKRGKKTWATVRRTKEERNAQGEETAKWTMTKQQTNRSGSIHEATTQTSVVARIRLVNNWWTCECLVSCRGTGKVGTSKHYVDPSSPDSRKSLLKNTTNTWTILSNSWRTNSKDRFKPSNQRLPKALDFGPIER